MKPQLRVIDTDLGDGRMHIALGQAMIDQHRAGLQPDTLRFMRFNPAAIIGRHQVLEDEVNLAHCKENSVEVVRRITGGGAIFLDPGQLGWELAISKKHLGNGQLGDITKLICEAAAKGLSTLGIDVQFRPRNDLEVDGRKISGTGGFFDGNTLFFQGTVLVDMNAADMVKALNIPEAKLAKRDLSSGKDRIVTLKELLGDKTPNLQTIRDALTTGLCEAFDMEPKLASYSGEEIALAKEYYDDEIGQDEFVFEMNRLTAGDVVISGSAQSPGGLILASLKLKGAKLDTIGEIVFNGDFFISPPRVLYDLEAHLKGVALSDVSSFVQSFFASSTINIMSVQDTHFIEAIQNAAQSINDKTQ
jgi:lipoate-protein ligase A